MQRHPVTVSGLDTLKEELENLKMVVRPSVIDAIAEARAHGDLKENAEYHAAREQQGFVEGRIQELEHKISHSQVIDIAKLPHNNRVVFGVTVNLINTETDEEIIYQIVGEDEADLKEGKISYSSPIARAVIGKELDDVAVVNTPSGEVEYEISSIDYV